MSHQPQPSLPTPGQILADTFGYSALRPPQDEIIETVVGGGDALVLMPTGGGKSLCYQIPALAGEADDGRLVLVLSPLIALMQDQVKSLTSRGIEAALEKIGSFEGVDRCYVFLFREDTEVMDNTHEWCAGGVEPQKHNLKGLPSNVFPWWMERLKSFEEIHIPRVADLPEEAGVEWTELVRIVGAAEAEICCRCNSRTGIALLLW